MNQANFTRFANFGGILLAVVLVLSFNTQSDAQCTLVCNNLVQVSLDEDCTYVLQPDDVLEGNSNCPNGNLVVEMKINGQWVPAIFTSSHIGQTIQVRVRDLNSGNQCSGFAAIYDYLEPEMVCTDLFLSCAITDYSPSYLENTLGLSDAEPDVTENCGGFSLNYSDTYVEVPCGQGFNGVNDLSAYVIREWVATDDSGNSSTCTQYLYFQRRHVDDVIMPADVTVDCSNPNTDPSNTGAPYLDEFGLQFELYPNNTICEMEAAYTDQVLPVCDGTYKILRTWTIYDWCLPTNPNPPNQNPLYHIQLVKVVDDQGPTFDCPADLTVNTNPWECISDSDLPDVIISDNCSQVASITARYVDYNGFTHDLNGQLVNFPGNNPWNPDTLGQLGYAENLPLGDNQIIYTVLDDCGNSSTCEFTLTVEDLTPPAAVCDEFTQVSLGISGMAFVNASTFDDGSYDNCSDVHFKVRRMDANGCQPVNRFYDQVKFCCEDVGDTLAVVFRVYDVVVPAGEVDLTYQEYHANDCMVTVFVDDKIKPTCQAPQNVTVSCENFDPSLWAYGFAFGDDNCCFDTITVSDNYSLFDTLCNKGTITRTFRVFDCGTQSSQCTQRIVVNYEQDYYIKFPNDAIVNECDGTGMFGEPEFFGEDCELLGVSFEDEVFTVVPDACYKIERTWRIINWCTYDPNGPCISIPNPTPNAISNHPANLPGPIVSAANAPIPWNPTITKINPTDQFPTNYSIYWNANANCYEYKQIIKIIDGEDPAFDNCPASPVDVCDVTPNDPLFWNDMDWWDNSTMSHDLCEAPAELCITVTDSCSLADVNLRYLLFLDLDGDGTMETVVSSTNTPDPNTVNFGNAGNPNFSGGDPRPFDHRAVPAGQKYRFTIDWTTNGNARTACVRWDWLQQPANLNDNILQGVVPQLPYGTHKIKWFAEDGCGNEAVCEYTFVVKDCKDPTVVCINGLSVNIMPTGMITLWASDFLQYTEDNCTPVDKIKIGIVKSSQSTGSFPLDGQGNPITSVTFDCNELGSQPVQLWAMDLAGNADFCETYLIVQDNMGNCQPGVNATVSGALKVDFNDPDGGLEDADLQISGQAPNGLPPISYFTNTDNAGAYNFNGVPVSGDYVVTPEKDNNYLNGVTTYDLVLISKHILGLQSLDSPYKMIGADANGSESITTFDIVEFRKLILGIYNELPNNTSWRFVSNNYVFSDPTNPFVDDYPQVYDIQSLAAAGMDGANFRAIKLGDMNGSAVANSLVSSDDRSAGTVFFEVEDREMTAGEETTVYFRTKQDLLAYQFTVEHSGLEVVEIIPGSNMSLDNFGVFAEKEVLTTSVDGNAEFAVTFRARKAGSLSEMLTAASSITKAVAYDEAGASFDVALRFNGLNGNLSGKQFALFQNTPNPVANTTNIGFNLPEDASVTLTLTNVEGRVVKVVRGDFAAGLNNIEINRSDLEPGVLFYQIETPTHSAVKKMVVVK